MVIYYNNIHALIQSYIITLIIKLIIIYIPSYFKQTQTNMSSNQKQEQPLSIFDISKLSTSSLRKYQVHNYK